jgi:hypothetical protein
LPHNVLSVRKFAAAVGQITSIEAWIASREWLKAAEIPLRVKSNLSCQIKLIWVVQSPAKKYFAFRFFRNVSFFASSRLDQRGGRVVTNAGRDAVDALAAR